MSHPKNVPSSRALFPGLLGVLSLTLLGCPPELPDSPTQTATPTATLLPTPTVTFGPTSTQPPTPTPTPALHTPSPEPTEPETPSPTPTDPLVTPTPTATIPPNLSCQERRTASYAFDENTGTLAEDSSGNNQTLSFYGDATFDEGMDSEGDYALLLDGDEARAAAPDSDILDMDTAVSVEVWLYLDGLPPADTGTNWWTVVSKGGAVDIGTERNYSLYIRSDGLVNWSLSHPDRDRQGECRYGVTPLEPLRWYHIVVTASPENGGTKSYYIDGELDLLETGCENTSLVVNGGSLIVGDSDEPNHNLRGKISDLTIRSCALDSQAVNELYNGSKFRHFE